MSQPGNKKFQEDFVLFLSLKNINSSLSTEIKLRTECHKYINMSEIFLFKKKEALESFEQQYLMILSCSNFSFFSPFFSEDS